MHYILDTGFFVVSREYYLENFPGFWKNMDVAASSNLISSVREVKKELERYGGDQEYLMDWISNHTNIFTSPSTQEQNEVRNIFEIRNYQNLIKKQTLLRGDPFADPFVIAKAMTIEGSVVVTREKSAKRDKEDNIQGPLKFPIFASTLPSSASRLKNL